MKKTYLLLGLILTLGVAPLALAADATATIPTKTVAAPAKAPVVPPVALDSGADQTDSAALGGAEGAAEKPEQDTQKWWQGALVMVIEAFVAIVTPILSILLMVLIRKWNLRIEQQKVDWCLDKALGAGEQKLKVALKDGIPLGEHGVKAAAVKHGTELLRKYGLAKKFGDWLADGIEARLGEKITAAGGAKQPALKGISELVAKPMTEKPVG